MLARLSGWWASLLMEMGTPNSAARRAAVSSRSRRSGAALPDLKCRTGRRRLQHRLHVKRVSVDSFGSPSMRPVGWPMMSTCAVLDTPRSAAPDLINLPRIGFDRSSTDMAEFHDLTKIIGHRSHTFGPRLDYRRVFFDLASGPNFRLPIRRTALASVSRPARRTEATTTSSEARISSLKSRLPSARISSPRCHATGLASACCPGPANGSRTTRVIQAKSGDVGLNRARK